MFRLAAAACHIRMRSTLMMTMLLTLAPACRREPKATVRTEAVTRGPISEIVSATGEVSALVTVTVGSQISGTIARLHADWNTQVKAGQVIAQLDPRLFEVARARAVAGLSAANADLARATVALADAERTARRTGDLFASRLVSQSDADSAVSARDGALAALKAAEARVLQAAADRDAADTSLSLCNIRSPIDGVVISRNVDVGQTVAASLQSPTLFVIANDLSRMQVLANVDEADVGKVKAGLAAQFTVDAFPGERFHGRIRDVRQAPNSIQGVVTYAAVLEADNPERKLRQGMTASVTIVTSKRDDALRIPNGALRYRPPEVKPQHPAGGVVPNVWADELPSRAVAVWKLQEGKLTRVPVRIGISDGHFSEVISGLAADDRIVVADAPAAAQGGKRGPF